MKPTALMTCKERRRDSFDRAAGKRHRPPITHYNYQSATFGGSSGRYLYNPARPFWNIADEYLKSEARHDFWSESALFAFISFTAALPLMNNLHALIEFARAISSH